LTTNLINTKKRRKDSVPACSWRAIEEKNINIASLLCKRYTPDQVKKKAAFAHLPGDTAPPIIVHRNKYGRYILRDGWHRCYSAIVRGESEIKAIIYDLRVGEVKEEANAIR
jgi:hypothetical protein